MAAIVVAAAASWAAETAVIALVDKAFVGTLLGKALVGVTAGVISSAGGGLLVDDES